MKEEGYDLYIVSDYHPTRGVRILEMEKEFTGDALKKLQELSKNKKTS